MKFEIVKLKEYCGVKSNIYSVFLDDDDETLFDKFIIKHKASFQSDIMKIDSRLSIIGNTTGAREEFFKSKQGNPGDLVCYLKYEKRQPLRLYCIRFGSMAIIIGGGGNKGKNIIALQDDKNLKEENYRIRAISESIYQRMKEGEICWSQDGKELFGNLKFEEDE